MRNEQFVIIIQLVIFVVLLGGSGCNSVQKLSAEASKTPRAVTEVTKEELKSRFREKNVKFVEKDSDEKPDMILAIRLKFVGGGNMRRVNLNGVEYDNYEYDDLITKLRSIFKDRESNGVADKNVILGASEAELADYKKERINVEDFEEMIAKLRTETNQIYIDFIGLKKPSRPPTPKVIPSLDIEKLKRETNIKAPLPK